MTDATTSNSFIEDNLNGHLSDLEDHLNLDAITYIGPIEAPLDDFVRDLLEKRATKRSGLLFALETNGGYIETAERICDTIHHHYNNVEFVIPNFAFSAGTVLAMSGHKIWMDYFSVLGPIDPQIRMGGRMIPALGYVEKFKEFVDKANQGNLNTAEMAFLIEKFDPAEIYHFEEAKKLSIDLLKKWLVEYKFKNWTKTQSKGKHVTEHFKKQRAQAIARKLSNPSHWHSHARGISMIVLDRDVGLQIDDFEKDDVFHEKLNKYYRLLKDYMVRRGHGIVVHSGEEYVAG